MEANNYLNFAPSVRISASNIHNDHTTNVAVCAASTYANEPGSGIGANILRAGTSSDQADIITGFEWATSYPQNAATLNNSESVYEWPGFQPLDRGFDYWSKVNNVFVTVAAGNDSQHVSSPAIAFNVLGVGSFNNNNTGDWSDDVMSGFSSWRNPDSPHGDREKPEVVAVGENLRGWGFGNLEINIDPGTSFAAPQVAGLAALLVNRNTQINVWPEAIRAIIMASAIHDLDGSPRITSGVDSRDGAGAIVADQALLSAEIRGDLANPCLRSCWWAFSTSLIPVNDSLPVTFFANSGQRVRVAISWWTAPDENYPTDILKTNFDLLISNPSGNVFTNSISTSQDNNFELVDFTAPTSGLYTIRVQKNQNSIDPNESNYVGIALVMPRYYIYQPIALKP